MEAEVQRYERTITRGSDGKVTEVGERAIDVRPHKFEFGAPNDEMSKVVGGAYLSTFNPDFLQRELGKDGTCARFYTDKRVLVDVADPTSDVVRKKRKLCFKNGFGYMCIPTGFEKNESKLKKLYEASISEYYQYEKLHPRPAVLQDVIITDEHGHIRRALMTAIDIRVGGGVTGNVEVQQRELQKAQELSKKEQRGMRLKAKLHRKIRESLQTGKPLRNPFIGPNKRLYAIKYPEKG